mmetsp:Transcript_11302/g.22239  ORF Transcript_11302/g.22239 Transcript_11302/m.22239 type:complete len:341 (+) Transcript_11302:1-1023(+)
MTSTDNEEPRRNIFRESGRGLMSLQSGHVDYNMSFMCPNELLHPSSNVIEKSPDKQAGSADSRTNSNSDSSRSYKEKSNSSNKFHRHQSDMQIAVVHRDSIEASGLKQTVLSGSASTIAEVLKQSLMKARGLIEQAKNFRKNGNLAQAEKDYKEAVHILEKLEALADKDLVLELAAAYYSLGLMYRKAENYMLTEEYHLKALRIREEFLDPTHPDLAASYNTLGNFFLWKKDILSAEECFIKALKIKEAYLKHDHPELASIFNNLGMLCMHKSEYDKAEAYCLKAKHIREAVLHEKHPDLAKTYSCLGNIYSWKNEYKLSELYYLKTLNITKQTLYRNTF